MATQNIFDLTDTWNAGGTTFTALKMNVTDTASAAGSLLLNFQVGGANRFSVSKTGAGTFAGQLIGLGTATNDSASSGQIGEYLEAEVLAGSAVNVPNATVVDITTLSLTAGDWDVWGTVTFVPAAGTLPTTLNGWVTTVALTTPTRPGKGSQFQSSLSFPASAVQQMPVGQRRISLSSTTTIYLGCSAAFTVSTLAAHGIICARRAR